MSYETVWSFKTRKFEITLDVAPEFEDPADCFEFQDDIDAVRNGDVYWFQARVTVRIDGGIVGADYLGGCAYKSFEEFRTSHFTGEHRNTLASKAKGVVYCDYFTDMVREAIKGARENIPRLRAA